MKKLMIFLGIVVAIATLLVRCSLVEEPEYKVDPVLQKFVNEFYQDAAKYNIFDDSKPSIKLITDNYSFEGGYYKKHNLIKMNRDFVINHLQMKTRADSNFVKLAVYHELGHSLEMSHRGPQLSIMNSGDLFEGKGNFMATVRAFNDQPSLQKSIIEELFLD